MAYPVYPKEVQVKPGPQPGYVPASGYGTGGQQGPANGRPREKQKPGATGVSSPGTVTAPPPVPQVGFKLPWPGMTNPQSPQPQAVIGQPSFNPLTGEWFNG